MTITTYALLAGLALATVGCEDKRSPPAETSTVRPASEPAAPAASKPGRDVSTLNACAMVKASEVAAITGGKLLTEPNATAPVCNYVFALGDDTVLYQVGYWPVAPYEAMLAAEPVAQHGEAIEGPWSEGYLRPGFNNRGFVLVAIWRGDVAMEVKGDARASVIALAKLAASRIASPGV